MNKLFRSDKKLISGICSGISEYLGVDVSVVGLATIVGQHIIEMFLPLTISNTLLLQKIILPERQKFTLAEI